MAATAACGLRQKTVDVFVTGGVAGVAIPPSAPLAPRTGDPAWFIVPGLLLLGVGVRALRFVAPFHWPFVWDETQWTMPALDTLRGGLPAISGPDHFGAAPAYPLAAWFMVAGSSTLAIDAFAYAIGVLIFWTTWLILRRLLDRPAALFGLAVLAVPPLFLAQWSLMSTNHVTNLLIGNLCLLATHTIFVTDPGRPRALLVLGILGGLGWWISPMIVVYLAPFALLAVRTGLVARTRIGWVAVGISIGGLPQWLYELWYFPSGKLALYQEGGWTGPFLERLAILGDFLPTFIGFPASVPRPWRVASFLLAVTLFVAALVVAGVRDRNELAWVLGRHRAGIERGPVIVWIFATGFLGLMLTASHPVRYYYLLPLYSVFPFWIGGLLGWLRRRGPRLAGTALSALLAFNGWTNWQDSIGTTNPSAPRWSEVKRRVGPVLRWLEDRGLDRVYMPLAALALPNFTLTSLAGGRVVFANLWDEPFVANGRLVDAAVSPPILVTEEPASVLRGTLGGIGFDVRETEVAGLRVLEPVPRFTTTFVPLPRDRWIITASHNASQGRDLLDGDASTSWDTGGEQTPGQWLAVDLGAHELLTRIDLLAIDWQAVPGAFRVEVSEDGQRWETVAVVPEYWGPLFFSEHHPFLKVRRGRVQAIFPPVRVRHVRLVQTARVRYHPWAAREVFAYAPGKSLPPVPARGEVTTALRREGVRFVYANHWLSAWVRVDSHDLIGSQDSNLMESDSFRTGPDPTALLPVRREAGTGILLGADADAAGIRAALEGQSVAVRETTAGPYRLLTLTPTPPPHHLDRSSWRVSANENGALAQRIVDGDGRTRWTSRGPGGPELTVTVDLGRSRELRGVEVRPGIPGRDLRLAASVDGVTWTSLAPLAWAGALYWTGSELLRNGGPRWAAVFPRTRVRFLRLSPAGPLRGPWTITEIECLE